MGAELRVADENAGINQFNALFGNHDVRVAPVSVEQAELARDAWRRYGKGSGHKAQLNCGDCMAYASARARQEPLLFKGNDFARTDIEPALKD